MLAVLSNVNMDPLSKYIQHENIVFADYGQYVTPFLCATSCIHHPDTTEVFVFLDGNQLLKDWIYQYPNQQTFEYLHSELDILFVAISNYLDNVSSKVIVILNTVCISPRTFCTYLEDGTSFDKVEHYINDRISTFVNENRSIIKLDWLQVVKLYGYNNLHDPRFWYLGRIMLNAQGFTTLYQEIVNLRVSYYGQTKKVLVLDLDNTLWGGVLGEDGIDGITLSEDGLGKAYRDFQKLIQSLKQLGIILCVNSKNNESDVVKVFQQHPMIILKYDDFIVKKVNWNNKANNILEISHELNVGLDSIIFIDDNPVECELVKAGLPAVIVPKFPIDPALLPGWFLEEVIYRYFAKCKVSKEDLSKTKQYKALIKRNELAKSLDIMSFIRSLEIKLRIHINSPNLQVRTSQLTQKTNQFNFTNRRYTDVQIEEFMNDPNYSVFSLEYQDRFGNEGIVGICITKYVEDQLFIDVFLLSCRIIGRNVEFAFLYHVLSYLKDKPIHSVTIDYIPTAKNDIARTFINNIAFTEIEESHFKGDINSILKSLKNLMIVKEIDFFE